MAIKKITVLLVILLCAYVIFLYGTRFYSIDSTNDVENNIIGKWNCTYYRGISDINLNVNFNFKENSKYDANFKMHILHKNASNELYSFNEEGIYSLNDNNLTIRSKKCKLGNISKNKNSRIYDTITSLCTPETKNDFRVLESDKSKMVMTQGLTEKYQCNKSD
jgi:hypothetical protein